MANGEPERVFARAGLGYTLRVEDLSLELRATHLKRSGGELHCRLTILCNWKGVKTVDGILHSTTFNLDSGQSRDRLAASLLKRTPGGKFDWNIYLEEFALKIAAADDHRETPIETGFDVTSDEKIGYAIEPIMARDVPSQIYGPGGSLKSLLAQACSVSVAAGMEIVPGLKPAIKGPVLYLDWETSAAVLNSRIRSICAGAEIDVPHGIRYLRMRRPLYYEAEDLSMEVAAEKNVMVVIDSAAAAIGPQGEHGGAEESALRFFEAINHLGNVSTLFVNHVPGDQVIPANEKPRKPYGSIYLVNYSRMNWEVRKGHTLPDGRTTISLLDLKPNDFGVHEPVRLMADWRPGVVRFELGQDAPQKRYVEREMSAPERIAEVLEGSRMTSPVIARTLGMDLTFVRMTLNRNRRFQKDDQEFWTTVSPDTYHPESDTLVFDDDETVSPVSGDTVGTTLFS